ncbi:PRC-barrel domain-containing protein [Halalkalibacter hemicellulosilyticus]
MIFNEATDGQLGKIDDIYFEAKTFTIRYLVGNTRTWMFGGKVLLHPESFRATDLHEKHISVQLTKEMIKNSPKPSDKGPITSDFEDRLFTHYGWHAARPMAGHGPIESHPTGQRPIPIAPVTDNLPNEKDVADQLSKEDSNPLRSVDETRGYTVHSKKGKIGKVEDILVCPETWKVKYIEIDLEQEQESRLVTIESITELNVLDQTITIDVDKDLVRESPTIEDSIISKKSESAIYEHYNQ